MSRFLNAMFILVTILTNNTANAGSYGFFEEQFRVDSSGFIPTVDGLWGQNIEGILGVEAFLLQSPGWSEAYVGPTFKFSDELTVGLSSGVQMNNGKFEPRFATSLFLNFNDFATSTIVEWGTNGDVDLWYDTKATYKIEWLTFGLHLRRFVGFGPTVSISTPENKLSYWLSWTPLDIETGTFGADKALFGAKLGF